MSEKSPCSALYRALLGFDTETAELQLQGVKTRLLISATVVAETMIFWAVLLTLRYRFLKIRAKMPVIELACLILTAILLVFTVLAIDACNPEKHLPFTLAFNKQLRNGRFQWENELILDVQFL